MSAIHRYFVPAPRGLVEVVAGELRALGAGSVRVVPGGCRVRGPLGFGYRLCLWSRCSTRVLLGLVELVAADADELHAGVRAFPWEDHLDPDGTLAIDFVGEGAGITHTGYGARKVKDAIVDRLRERCGRRPSVDREAPDVRIHVFAQGRGVSVSLDLAGESLHRRGWRIDVGPAPLKENLAAAMLAIGGWPEIVAAGGGFVDPLAGAGTLAIEAAQVAADIAPGLGRARFGFERWRGHDAAAWAELLADARARAEQGRARLLPPIVAADHDPAAVEAARANAARAGVSALVEPVLAELEAVAAPRTPPGLVATNPPYGERLGDRHEARHTVGALGRLLRERFAGWTAVVLLSEEGGASPGIPPASTTPVANGPIAAEVLLVRVPATREASPAKETAFARRLAKNVRALRRWAAREQITCYRAYDADIPEYAVAVNLYEGRAHVQEYEAPATVDPAAAARRRDEVLAAIPAVLSIPPEEVHFKVRRRQRGKAQYGRQADEGRFVVVHEGGHRFEVNLDDYLDTGLFLDHRLTRARLAELAPGGRFLNLYCYTGSATVYAAKAGARSTTSVDLSNTYLDWARRNLALNGIDGSEHRLVRAEVGAWLRRERDEYDLVFLDPPTFSTSKAMQGTLDLQRDQVELIDLAMARLAKDGVLVFSTNARKLTLAPELTERHAVEDIGAATIPRDFARRPDVHRCWIIRRR